jgi:hypothetical protein
MTRSLLAGLLLLACAVPALAIYCKVWQLASSAPTRAPKARFDDRPLFSTSVAQVGYGQRIKENNREVAFWAKTMVGG